MFWSPALLLAGLIVFLAADPACAVDLDPGQGQTVHYYVVALPDGRPVEPTVREAT